jgi:hypothetical protein
MIRRNLIAAKEQEAAREKKDSNPQPTLPESKVSIK